MRDRTTGERIILELPHSPRAYQTRYYFPFGYLWAYPAVAWGALREAIPWEALAFSLVAFVVAWLRLGSDLGTAIGASITLPLVAVQMMRTRTFITPSRIVRQRGLLPLRRAETPHAAIRDGRAEYPVPGTTAFGDIVLATSAGEQRLRAIGDPESVLRLILGLRASGGASAECVTSGRTSG